MVRDHSHRDRVRRGFPVGLFRQALEATPTFNTSLFGSLLLASLLLPVVGAFAWLGPAVLDVPFGEEGVARCRRAGCFTT